MTTIAVKRIEGVQGSRETTAFPVKALSNVLVLTLLATIVVSVVLLVGLDGWSYYRTPRAVRGYLPAHRLLRPSGPVGQALGLGGLLLMFVPMLYAIRKKSPRLAWAGSMKTWLQVHIFCGVFGPVLVTYHTSFKFNGIISVAYWLMVMVAASGFVGRYLYVRIPRTLRGTELTLGELQTRADDLKQELAEAGLPAALLAKVQRIEAGSRPPAWPLGWVVSLVAGDAVLRVRLGALRRELLAAGVHPGQAAAVVSLTSECATTLRRVELLARTKRLFDLWHLFHQPLVYFLFLIVLLHVVVVSYMGYSVLSGLVPH